MISIKDDINLESYNMCLYLKYFPSKMIHKPYPLYIIMAIHGSI